MRIYLHLYKKAEGTLRPDIERLIVNGENTKENLLQWPFGAVMPEYVLVVFEITRQRMVLHQLILHLIPQPPTLSLLPSSRTMFFMFARANPHHFFTLHYRYKLSQKETPKDQRILEYKKTKQNKTFKSLWQMML